MPFFTLVDILDNSCIFVLSQLLTTMVGYIYKTTNKVNGMIYVGQHLCSYFDRKYRGSGTLFKQALEEYGWDNFITELLCWAETREKLSELERTYIEAHRGQPGYNLSKGGSGGARHIYVNLDTKQIHLSIKSAAKAAGVSESTLTKWVNVGGSSKGMAEYYNSHKDVELRSQPKNLWITHKWAKLPNKAILRMKNPIFA
jgi:hypothetical protein